MHSLCLIEFPSHLPLHIMFVLDCCIIWYSHINDVWGLESITISPPPTISQFVFINNLLKCLKHSLPWMYIFCSTYYMYMIVMPYVYFTVCSTSTLISVLLELLVCACTSMFIHVCIDQDIIIFWPINFLNTFGSLSNVLVKKWGGIIVILK